MAQVNVNIYTPAGNHVGYFEDPELVSVGGDDWEIKGEFFEPQGQRPLKIDMNPEALPYSADLAQVDSAHDTKKLVGVYVQRCRQPIVMSGRKG